MRNKLLLTAAVVLAAIAIGLGVRLPATRAAAPAETKPQPQPAPPLDRRATPADRQVNTAQVLIDRAPRLPDGYNSLAAAYMQKARETGDFGYNARVETALKRSFEAAPDNHDAVRLQAYLLLTYHRFDKALDVARHAVQQSPRDYEAHGALVDALVELGKYEEARKAVQTMLDLRPYTASYARASYLRSLYGMTDGAIEAMQLAVESANPGDPESIAWTRVHLGIELMNAGRLAEAEHQFDGALFALPGYHLALAAKARARIAAGDTEAAVDFYKRAQDRVPLPDTVIALGDLYAKLGRTEEARRQYDLVEFIEKTSAAKDTYSRQLALFYADHNIKLDEALAMARREREWRSDIFTCDALAWCLYKKHELGEAKKYINEAMRLGTRDARILYHAGMIYKALDERQIAARYLKEALAINPTFDVLQAEVAMETLRAIGA